MASIGRIGGMVAVLCMSGGCYEGAGAPGEGVGLRELEINTPELNGPMLQGPMLQGPMLQGPMLQGIILNGPMLQGPMLQGPMLQGPMLQGPMLQGVRLNGPMLQGPMLQGPMLQGSEFTGTVLRDGESVQATRDDFIGSEWELRVEQVMPDGTGVVEYYILRIDDIYNATEVDPTAEFDDIWLYDISHRPKLGSPTTWKPLCLDQNNEGVPAVPLKNYWNLETGDRIDDPNVFTFGCTNAVLAKCVMWGYRPWATHSFCKNADKGKTKKCQQVPLTDYHQACTRMARADYCGDGTPWTVEGNSIDVRDLLNPPIEQPTTDWTMEAEWNPDGAFCVDDIRMQSWKAQGQWPECFTKANGKHITKNNCGSLKNERALMYSTFPPAQ